LEKFLRVKEILDRSKLIKNDLPKRYIRTLHYIINAQIELKDLKSARESIKLMRSLSGTQGFTGQNLETQIFVASYLGELRLLDRSADYGKAMELVDPILKGMEEMAAGIHKESEIEFYFTLAIVHFGANEMNKALFWLNKVLNDNEPTLRQDIFTYARLFNLVVHFELGNYDLLEYIVRSTSRFMNKRHDANDVEVLLIDHIKKMARSTDPEVKIEHFAMMHKEFKVIFKDPLESMVLKYFDVMSWVESRMEGITFAEVVKRNNKA